jgi:probable phosphoglycerate mutase
MRFLRSLLALAAFCACRPVTPRSPTITDFNGATTVIVVRHAEKAAEPAADPPLTAAGQARAEALVAAVRGLPVRAVVSTDYARTRATAAPLAASLGLTVELVDAHAPDHARQVAAGVLARHRAEVVVVVGHSNTVPDIVAALGAPKPAAICDAEYDNLYVVRVPAGGGAATVERRKYGAASVLDAACRAMH